MKRILLIVSAIAMVAGMSSCKPKQSAYRAAYERAKQQEVAQQPSNNDEITPIVSSGDTDRTVSERVTPAQGEDASGLRAFSVVIGSFQNITNAKSLKERMVAEGYRALLAQNEKGMYRVIISSFDTKADAVASRESVKARFAPMFQDAWILQRAF